MNTLSNGTKTITASKTTRARGDKAPALITCYDAATGVTTNLETTVGEARRHMAILFTQGWR